MQKLEFYASKLGMFFIVAALIAGCAGDDNYVFGSGFKTYLAAILLLPLGASFGYGLSTLMKMTPKECRTIALETGIQNTTLTLAVIILSFPTGKVKDCVNIDDADDKAACVLVQEALTERQEDLLAFPLLFSFFLILTATALTFGFYKLTEGEEEEEGETKDEMTAVGVKDDNAV